MHISKMKRLTLAVLAAGTALAATPASATITLAYSVDAGAITFLADDTLTPGKISYSATPGGANYFIDMSGTGAPFPGVPSPTLLTQALTVKALGETPAGVLHLYVTDSNLASYSGGLLSSFTSNTLSGSATAATISSYFNANNALYGVGGTLLASNTFTGLGLFSGQSSVNAVSPWSETVRYDITFGGSTGTFNGTGNIQPNLPEPTTWMMMLLGFGAIGFGLRTRRSAAPKVSVKFA